MLKQVLWICCLLAVTTACGDFRPQNSPPVDDAGSITDAGGPAEDAGNPTEDAGPPSRECFHGTWFEPGCSVSDPDPYPSFEAGCYAACDVPGRPCSPAGRLEGLDPTGLCVTVNANPCVCDPGEDCCEACSMEENICILVED